MSWCLTLVTNKDYLEKAFNTIYQARNTGKWNDDIILLLENGLKNDLNIQKIADNLNIELFELPQFNMENYIYAWNNNKEHANYSYCVSRYFQLMKFHIFNIYMKKWKYIFYIDAGQNIFGDLNRFKNLPLLDNILYAHNDNYPTYNNLKLHDQFNMNIDYGEINKYYNLDCDYFQSGILIFNTNIIDESIIDRLVKLVNKFPNGRGDQPYLNLLFTCEKNIWKQIPICDNIGFLYDFWERYDKKKENYVILKYPRT